jgi:hypothetical protein
MKARIGIFAIGIALAPAANAADLPTTKSAPPSPPVNCFSSLWTYLNTSAADCPLSYAGFTAYATIDVGLGYSSNGAPASSTYSNSVYSFVGKQSYGAKWLWTPNGINQSVVGINMKESIPWLPGWSLVGAVETGFSPFSGNLVNGPRSLVQNNGLPLVLQTANSDSSRADTSASPTRLSERSPSAG